MLKSLPGNKSRTQKTPIIYYTDSKLVGGAEKSLYLLLKNINCDIYAPILICPDGIKHEHWRASIKKLGIRVLPIATRNIFSVVKFYKIYKAIKSYRPEIIHFQFWSPYSCGIGLLCSWFLKIPITVGTEHSFVPLSEAEWYLKPIKALYQIWRKKLINYPTTVSDASKKMMQKHQLFSDKKIFVIHNGIKTQPLPPEKQAKPLKKMSGKINIAFVARLEEGKGHQTLIDAFTKLDDKTKKDIQVHCIGGGSLKSRFISLVKKKDLAKKIIFWGERNDVRQILPIFDFFVFPSYSENFPFAILEAMDASLAIVASDVGGIKEALKDKKGGFVIPAKNAAMLAKKIALLTNNPGLREKMGNFNKRFVASHFNDKIMTKQTETVYHYALSKLKK